MAAQEVWKERLARMQSGGLGIDEFAVREGVKPGALRWWRWRLGEHYAEGKIPPVTPPTPTPPQVTRPVARPRTVFVEVDTASPSAPSATVTSSRFEVVLGNGRVVRVPAGFSDAELARVLAITEGTR